MPGSGFGFQSFQFAKSYVALEAGNGYGAVSTKVRRYQTINANVGSAITYSDNANTGAQFVINESGLYSMTRVDVGAPSNFGFSLNSASGGATAINLLAWPERVLFSVAAATATCAGFNAFYFASGSILRPHDDGTCTANTASAQLLITQVEAVL